MASFPNRCQHLKVNGTQCGSPALRRNRFCFFHKRFQDERIRLTADRKRRGVPTFTLPLLEDANSIQVALMQVMRALLTQQIDHKTASLLLYALQTASSNLRFTDFKPFRHEVVLDPRDAAATPLGQNNAWDDEDFEEQDDQGAKQSPKHAGLETRCQNFIDCAFAAITARKPEECEPQPQETAPQENQKSEVAQGAAGESLVARHKKLMATLDVLEAADSQQKKPVASVSPKAPPQKASNGAESR